MAGHDIFSNESTTRQRRTQGSLHLLWVLLCLLAIGLSGAWARGVDVQSPTPVVDGHLHYKSNQAEVTSPEQAVAALRGSGVELAVITGTPSELALRLYELAPDLVLPIYGPYKAPGQWYGWQHRIELVDEAREGIQRGPYRGIGELHLIGGFALRWRDNEVLKGLLAVGAAYDVPVLVHMEFSRAEPTLSLCRGNPGNRLVLAHAGAPMSATDVGRILEACPNLWVDLSARDPWRYVRNPIVDAAGRLLPEWEALILAHPARFIIGSDAVWPVEHLDAWDQPDRGWAHIGEFLDFHRRWASFLPPRVAEQVLRTNARELFCKTSHAVPSPCSPGGQDARSIESDGKSSP